MVTILLLLLPFMACVVVQRGVVSQVSLGALFSGTWLAGAYVYIGEGSSTVFVLSVLGTAAFVGIAYAERHSPRPAISGASVHRYLTWRVQRMPVTMTVVALTALHFARAGVPLLSDSVETSRFAISASGLGGVPSRTYLFVLPVVAVWAGVASRRRPDGYAVLVWIALLLSRLAGGLKSGMLEVVTLAVTVGIWRVRPLRVTKLVSWGAAALVLSVGSAALVGGLYETVSANGQSSFGYLSSRATSGTVSAAASAVESYRPDRSTLIGDFGYYLPTYLGLSPITETISREVAVLVYGGALDDGSYVSPVTVSLPVNLYIDFGYLGVVLGLLIWARLALKLCKRYLARNELEAAVFGVGVVMWFRIYNNGGLAYHVINYVGSLLILALILCVCGMASDSARRQPSASLVLASTSARSAVEGSRPALRTAGANATDHDQE